MTYEEALKVLELSGNFTEDDIKKNYHKLVKKYHPDVNGEKSTEKMQQINEAYKILTSEKENTGNYQNYSRYQSTDIEKYREEKLKSVSYYTECSFQKYKEISGLKNSIISLQRFSRFMMDDIKGAHSKDLIDILYEHFLDERRKEIEIIIHDFFIEYYIDKDKANISINYDAHLDDICKSLLKIKYQFSKSEILKRKLQNEVSIYRHIPFYDKVKTVFDYVISYTYNNILKSNFKDEEKYIKEMHDYIKDFIDEYYFCQSEIEKLNILAKDTQNLEILEDFNKLEKEFDRGASALDIKDFIVNLKAKIEGYHEAKKLEQKNLPMIQKQYDLILKKYMTVIQDLKDIKDIEKINLATDIFKKVMIYFDYIKQKNISSLNWLNEITFLDMNEIQNIEERMQNKENDDKEKSCEIYVLKNRWISNKMVICKVLSSYDDFLYIGGNSMSKVTTSTVPIKEFKEYYISLDEYLEAAIYSGYKISDKLTLLYESNGIEFCLTDEYLTSKGNSTPLFISTGLSGSYNPSSRYNRDAEPYKDKEFMKQQVIKYVDIILNELHFAEKTKDRKLVKKIR